jgi:TonB family protein
MRAIIVSLLASVVHGASSCPPAAREPYLVCQVDRAPRPDSGNVAPTYPVLLLQADVSGTVRVRFVVDKGGRVDPGSVTVVDTTNALFGTAARAAIRTWMFEPGSKAGQPVAVRWEQILMFSVPRDSELPFVEPVVLARDTAPDGVPRIVVGVPDHEPMAIIGFSNRELLDAQRAALPIVAPPGVRDSAGQPRVTVCLTINRGGQGFAPDAETLRALEAPGRRVVMERDCPLAYVMRMYDTQRAPPGYIDPYLVDVVDVSAWNADILIMKIDVSHHAATTTFQCWATRGTTWRPKCRRYRSTVG